jgi:methylenetetrahydrofolate reductase (NADPH)
VHQPTISFELAPPRRPDAAPRFWETAGALMATRPDFISVTYGAGGSDRTTARHVMARLVADAPVLPIAHLTCVGASAVNMREVIGEFLDAGTRVFLALRGDPPAGQPDWRPDPDGLSSAVELISLLREVDAERAARHPGDALRRAAHPLRVAVAAFPNGNPAAGTTRDQEVERLALKQHAGADFAITQLVYDATSYADFVTDARAAGVTIPILAGVVPATDPARLRTVARISGIEPPACLVEELEALADPQERHTLGIERSAEVARGMLAAGAPGLHVYTFNQHRPAIDLLREVGLLPTMTDA